MPADYPGDTKADQLNLMARRGQVFAVAVSHTVASWPDAEALAARLRKSLPASFSCESDSALVRCSSNNHLLVIGSAEDVPGERPAASMIYVRDCHFSRA